MAKFSVRVTSKAKDSYTVEVEASDDEKAEALATSHEIFAANTSEDFQVPRNNCSFEFETEQLTADCPDCGKEHLILSDDLPVCYCGAFGHNPYAGSPENLHGRAQMRPHLIVDGVCTPEPWWYEDQDYCAECGAEAEAAEPQP